MCNFSPGMEVQILRDGAKAGPLMNVKVSLRDVQVLSFLLPCQNTLEILLDYFILNEGKRLAVSFCC